MKDNFSITLTEQIMAWVNFLTPSTISFGYLENYLNTHTHSGGLTVELFNRLSGCLNRNSDMIHGIIRIMPKNQGIAGQARNDGVLKNHIKNIQNSRNNFHLFNYLKFFTS
ncbi:MAG: hypothetical protein LBR06_05800 [Bacteroidales bacterium]|nr:hypothetical protein [Bacteroidales bacterium]